MTTKGDASRANEGLGLVRLLKVQMTEAWPHAPKRSL
jgi:hypothetical protein